MNGSIADALVGRSALVTGHTGFKGSWLCLWLHRLGAKVSGYSLAPHTQPNNFTVSDVRRLLVQHYEADLRDYEKLSGAIRETRPEVIFHLAAQSLVREGYRSPRRTLETNIMGAVNLLEAVRTQGRPCVVVVVSSDKCYENHEYLWGYREIDPMGGHDPYSASKGCAELVTAAYRRSFFPSGHLAEHGVKVATARAGNVIGGGDWSKDRIVTDVVRHLVEGRPVPVRNPASVRPWQHVLEPLSGYLTLASRMLTSDDATWCDGWNFGPLPGEDIPVSSLVEQFIAAWGKGSWQHIRSPDPMHEAGVLRLSVDKALARLDWRPRWSLTEAVRRTARWYARYAAGGGTEMQPACLDDIAAYESTRSVPLS